MKDRIVFMGQELLKGQPEHGVEEKRTNPTPLPSQRSKVESRENPR